MSVRLSRDVEGRLPERPEREDTEETLRWISLRARKNGREADDLKD